MYPIPPKLAMINDMAGYGRCSTTVAIPVISIMKVQVCPVPTSLFSNHTGFSFWHCDDYTEQMPAYLAAWEKLSLYFDGIYCGFLGNDNQIAIVADFIQKQKEHNPSIHVIIDPVLGDNGRVYSTITAGHCHKMKELVGHADIITPNLTEACILTNTPFRETDWTESELARLADILHQNGSEKIVITGIRTEDTIANFVSGSSSQVLYKTTFCGQPRHGTGDIFASVIAADAVNGVPFEASIQKAADFVSICTEGSAKANVPLCEGVIFEQYLSRLL